jgi:5-carboxymethyl-2-hydroxymuconate isomerase
MPHFTIEYSRNLEDRIDFRELAKKIHQAALSTGVFEVAAVRTRTEPRDVYVIADGHPDNAFVAITARIASGRSAEVRQHIGETVFNALCDYLAKVYETTPIGLTMAVEEIDPVASFKKNSMREVIKQRTAMAGVGKE